jgi:orotidine-5'-phosphate decarboxylase
MNFPDRLRDIQKRKNTLLCIGLDPDPAKLPKSLSSYANPVQEFNRRIIAETSEFVCAYKLNLAFYESLGRKGWEALEGTLSVIPSDVLTIGDAKRGDIGNSSEAYAKMLLIDFRFGATTVNPYMGEDSVRPFLQNPEQGAFILAVTSNPGAKDFQRLPVRGKPLYEHVIAKVKKWNTSLNCGLVVGATRPKEMRRIRSLVPSMPILIPGIGAQGGDVEAAVRYGCTKLGDLALLTSSRGIIYASGGEDFADASRQAAISVRKQVNAYRDKHFG